MKNEHDREERNRYRTRYMMVTWLSLVLSLGLWAIVFMQLPIERPFTSDPLDLERLSPEAWAYMPPDFQRGFNETLSKWTYREWRQLTGREKEMLLSGMMLSTYVWHFSLFQLEGKTPHLIEMLDYFGRLNHHRLEWLLFQVEQSYKDPSRQDMPIWALVNQLSQQAPLSGQGTL